LKRILFIGGISLLFIAFAVMFVYVAGRREYMRAREAWVDLGGVLDPAKIAPPASEIPDDQNAAVAYEPVFEFLESLPDEEQELLGEDPNETPGVTALVEKCEDITAQLREATKIERCRWDADYTQGGNVVYAHLGRSRDAARILAADAMVAEMNGDFKRACNDIEAMLRLGKHVGNERIVTGELTEIAIQQLAVSLYKEMFSERFAPPNDVPDIVADIDRRAELRSVLLKEVALSIDLRGKAPPRDAGLTSYWDLAYYLRTMHDVVTRAAKPYYEAPITEADHPWYASISETLLAFIESTDRGMALSQLEMVMLVAAEQLREYKAEHGAYPEPDEFEAPIDPVTGQPLGYERDGEGFVLRSAVSIENASPERFIWRWEQ